MNDPLKKYRHRIRSWLNRRRLAQELRFYRQMFREKGLTIPDEGAIRKILQARHPHASPKPKGTLNILAVYHHYTWESDSLLPALAKFGDVRHYDWFDEFNHQEENRWHGSLKAAMNRHLVEMVASRHREKPLDLVFTYLSGEIIGPEALKELAAVGVPMVNLALNDKEQFVGRIRNGLAMGARDICRYFDLSWTSTEDALKKYCVEGATPLYLPEGANPDAHRPVDCEKTIDVSFVGQCYGNRPEVIGKLIEKGIRVEAYGHGWPNGPLSLPAMTELYSRSRINLGFGGVSGHQDTFCLKGRDFEIPMSGGLYLTEHHPELEAVFVPGKEIMTYTGFDDLLEKIRYLLAHPDVAEKIRLAGYRRARTEHTWEMRFAKVFSLFGLIADA
jgi:spore maturation protein CgeB